MPTMSRMPGWMRFGTKMFFGFALAASAFCSKASAQQLNSCDKTGNVQPCIPKFVDPMPIPTVFAPTPGATVNGKPADYYEIAAREFKQQVLSTGAVDSSGNQLMTTVWGYGQNNTHHPLGPPPLNSFSYDPTAPTAVCDLGTGNTAIFNCFSYPAPTLFATVGKTVQVKWINDLVCHTGDLYCTPGQAITYTAGVKPSFDNHWANPSGICNNGKLRTDCQGVGGYTGPVPLIVHAHGEVSPSESDGLPEAWNLPASSSYNTSTYPFPRGSDYCQSDANGFRNCAPTDGAALFTYPNRQFGTTLFFHDHALGVTTENVYMGLAGFYLLTGTNTNLSGLSSFNFSHEEPSDCGALTTCADGSTSVTGGLPQGDCNPADIAATDPFTQDSGCFELGLAISDKAFNTDGSLKFSENGNTIVVNGKTWPFLNVEPRKYRLRIVVAAPTSRFDLTFPSANNDNGTAGPTATITQIGADGGFLPHPAKLTKPLSLMPGERADVIMDFSSFWQCPPPFGNGCSVDLLNNNGSGDTGTVMRFNIVRFAGCDPNILTTCFPPAVDTSCNGSGFGNLPQLTCTSADTFPHRSTEPVTATPQVRQVSLFDDHLGNCPIAGCVNSKPLPWDGAVTETPTAGKTEVWEMYDFMDSHPMHLHEAQFQVIERENMTTHVKTPPGPGETGFKDTVQANGGQITRLRVTFQGPVGPANDPNPEIHPGLFAWHCHINPHEDNEMMRPMCVVPPGSSGNPNAENFCQFPGPVLPVLSSISLNSGAQGANVPVTITGTGLTGATKVNVSGTGVTYSGLTVVGDTTVTAVFAIAPNATLGARNVTVTTPGGTSNAVTFTVLAPNLTLTVSAASLNFTTVSRVTPPTQILQVSTNTGATVLFLVAVSTTTPTGGTWLTAFPTVGTTSTTLFVSAFPAGLAAGTYNGTVTITSAAASNSPLSVPVTFTVTP